MASDGFNEACGYVEVRPGISDYYVLAYRVFDLARNGEFKELALEDVDCAHFIQNVENLRLAILHAEGDYEASWTKASSLLNLRDRDEKLMWQQGFVDQALPLVIALKELFEANKQIQSSYKQIGRSAITLLDQMEGIIRREAIATGDRHADAQSPFAGMRKEFRESLLDTDQIVVPIGLPFVPDVS